MRLTGEKNQMDKGGVTWTTSFTLIEISLAAIIIGLVSFMVAQTSDHSVIHMKYFSRELSITTLIAQASPGELLINYSPHIDAIKRFNYTWKDSLISVASEGPPRTYPFLYDKQLWGGNAFVPNTSSIYFLNSLNMLTISKGYKPPSKAIPCPESPFKPGSIFIDPVHGEFSDAGLNYNGFRESEAMCRIASGVAGLLPDIPKNSSRPQNELGIVLCTNTFRLPLELIEAGLDDSQLVVSFGLSDSASRFVKAYVPVNNGYKAAYSIACQILNRMKESYPKDIQGVAVIPVEFPEGVVMDTQKPTIRFELGGIKSDHIRAMLKEPYGIYNAIGGVLNG